MAKLQTETITITVSRMVKNNAPNESILSEEVITSLEAVIAELAGDGVMVEIE